MANAELGSVNATIEVDRSFFTGGAIAPRFRYKRTIVKPNCGALWLRAPRGNLGSRHKSGRIVFSVRPGKAAHLVSVEV